MKRTAIACAVAAAALFVVPGLARAETTIGLYRDARGTSCSFNDNTPGLVTVHVVVHPDERGFRGVRFSAPVPACFGGVWLQDVTTERTHMIGDSQTGISVASSWCEDAPIEILQIRYLRTGSTSECCEFPVLEDPFVHMIEVADCDHVSYTGSGITSYFNANASCRCGTNVPPAVPSNPSPVNGDPATSVSTSLSWSGDDPDSNLAGFDLYFGTQADPPLHASGLTQPSFQPAAPLDELTTYYWRVVARDDWDAETAGLVWTFTTRLTNTPPSQPHDPWPPSGSTGVPPTAQLVWNCEDVDAEPIVYDIYFGTNVSPPLVESGLTDAHYSPAMTWETDYYWRVVARDAAGHETPGPVWTFCSRPENFPPEIPSSPSPANGGSGRPLNGTLTWSCSDRDASDTIVYDVYLGASSPPPLVATGRATKSYAYTSLTLDTDYYWKVVARDNHGAETAGPVWSFSTRTNSAPLPPSSPVPADGAVDVSLVTSLSWQCSDPEGDGLKYDVYFGTSATPPLMVPNVTGKTWTPGTLQFGRRYYWRIVARDAFGLATSGATWSFVTKVEGAPPAPSTPAPANLATNVAIIPRLTWVCTDPDGEQLEFDVYLGTGETPPLAAAHVPAKSYTPTALLPTTRYYWRVVARDPAGHEAPSPTWYFTTRANSAPGAAVAPSPANNSQALLIPTLTWYQSDPDGQPLTFDVYFGDVSPPPLATTGITTPSYSPGPLIAPKKYYWKVVASDGFASTSGPVWSFTTVVPGDANMDGQITVADATCAMDRVVWMSCGSSLTADVDCSGAVTAMDARCIHRRALAMECPFCGEGTVPPGTAGKPGIGVLKTWEWNDTLYCRLGVWNVPSLRAFGFSITGGAPFVRPQRRAITNDWVSLRSFSPGFPGIPSLVAAYTLEGSPTAPNVASEFIDLRFLGQPGEFIVRIDGYTDDLAGADALEFYLGDGLPVLITRFTAAPVANGIELSWSLESDEAMESFTLYRSDEKSNAKPIANGAVNGRTGRHLDTSVSSGSTYEYQLVIRTASGEEFRSQTARATTAAIALTLHQNHPNPFNPQTSIRYDLPTGPERVRVRLWILDISGRIVRTLVDEEQAGGSREARWNGTDDHGNAVSSGVYFSVLDAGGKRLTRKLVLLK